MYLRVWDCLAFYKILDPKSSKLSARGTRSVFIGYAENSKAYRLLNLYSNVIVESRDVEFIEDKFQHDSNIELESIIVNHVIILLVPPLITIKGKSL